MKLILGDCIEEMKKLPDNSVDFCLTDPPYGTTQCKWDSVIPFEVMWKELKRIVKDNGTICLFGAEPFSSSLRMSNLKMFKYDWIWQKNRATNHLNAKKQPLRSIEIISVFYKKQCLYRPQLTKAMKGQNRNLKMVQQRSQCELYGSMTKESKRTIPLDMSYPRETISFKCSFGKEGNVHPTQKPVPLLEYLIKTYTLEGETVLDFTAGSFSTGVACVNLNRSFIGIEKYEDYYNIGCKRVQEAIDAKISQQN